MKDQTSKKKWIIYLLSLVCVGIIALLIQAPKATKPRLTSLHQADSVITKELDSFSIPKRYIKTRTYTIDSTFSRVHYTVQVPKAFSKTYFHSELDRQLRPLGITSPASVTFPERTLNIHLSFDNTIFRTITLVADSSLKRPIFPAHLLFYIDEPVKSTLIGELKAFTEQKGIVIRSSDPAMAAGWYDQVKKELQPVFFWINHAEESLITDLEALPAKAAPFQKIQNRLVLVLPEMHQAKNNNSTNRNKLSQLGISKVADGPIVILNPENGRYLFEEELARFRDLARQNRTPTLLVKAEKRSFLWLEELLHTHKKSGLTFTLPEVKKF